MAYGICDIPKCRGETFMGWRPLTERTGRQICEFHWEGHKNGRFNLFDAFGFKRPMIKTKPVKKQTEHCACGGELQPGHRLCKNCAAERERLRMRKYYYYEEKPPFHTTPRRKIERQNPYLLRECPDCGKPKLRKRQRYCDDCSKKRRRENNRERQRKYYKVHRVSS
jgi:hypothetical protein